MFYYVYADLVMLVKSQELCIWHEQAVPRAVIISQSCREMPTNFDG